MLQPIDLFVALKLAVSREGATYAELASEMGLSSSQVHRSVKRCQKSGLIRANKTRINEAALLEFLIHAARYVFPAELGPTTRGVPTAHSAPPLKDDLVNSNPSLVWPDPNGSQRGESVEPLHKRASFAAKNDSNFYEMLALVDALRVGRAREREIAKKYLRQRLHGDAN